MHLLLYFGTYLYVLLYTISSFFYLIHVYIYIPFEININHLVWKFKRLKYSRFMALKDILGTFIY